MDYDQAAGQLLRHFRREHALTLEEASTLLHVSVPILSRKERGQVTIDRLDIRFAIKGYQLTPLEAQLLWSTAGLLPDPPRSGDEQESTLEAMAQLLPLLPGPAYIRDEYWYLCAWNGGLEAIWRLRDLPERPIHVIIDGAFSPI
ncbi:MAG: helix-turn-helix domain-containing protein [Chloroflexota bacterium]|nr:helix-turn-helix domain-containing protein [Chloroflexota bacterium]